MTRPLWHIASFNRANFVKAALLGLFRSVCVLVAAAGSLVVLLAACCLVAMLIVWFQEPHLQLEDKQIVLWACVWFITASLIVVLSWWARASTLPLNHPDRCLRLVPSNSNRLEDMVQLWFELGFYAVSAAWIWASCIASPGMKMLILLLSMIGVYVAMHVRILIHELGHLFAAKAVGLSQCKLQVGVGPLIWSRLSRSGLLFEWRLSATAGWVLALPRSNEWQRLRQLLFVAAGPFADLMLIWGISKCLTASYGSLAGAFGNGVTGILTFTLFWWTVISAVSGLIPHRVCIGGRKLWTDGYWILHLCTGRSMPVEPWKSDFDTECAFELLRSDVVNGFGDAALAGVNVSQPAAMFHEQQQRLSSRLLKGN